MKRILFLVFIGFFLCSPLLQAKEVNILVWANATNDERFRTDAIKLAAAVLNEELRIEGSDIQVTVEDQRWFGQGSWEKFKQAFSLAIEAGKGPHIVVSGHEDIPVWGKSGLIQPIEELADLKQWPLNDIYPNLWAVASWGGLIWGIPQDAESRPLFGWIPYLKQIGYSDEDIKQLPAKVVKGEYTLYDVLEDAKKIQDKGLVQPGYGFYPRVSNGPDYWQFYLAFGGKMSDDTGKLLVETAALQKYYQFFHDAVFKYKVTRKNHIGTQWNQWYQEVASGKAGLWHGGTWHYARYTKGEGLTDFFEKVVFTLIPSGETGGKGVTITHPLVYLVSKRAQGEDAEIAARLITIATEPRYNSLHAIASAHLGVTRTQSKVEMYANDRWTAEATALLWHAVSLPNNTDFGQLDQIVWKGLTAAWSGQKSPAEATQIVAQEIRSTMGDKVTVK